MGGNLRAICLFSLMVTVCILLIWCLAGAQVPKDSLEYQARPPPPPHLAFPKSSPALPVTIFRIINLARLPPSPHRAKRLRRSHPLRSPFIRSKRPRPTLSYRVRPPRVSVEIGGNGRVLRREAEAGTRCVARRCTTRSWRA